MKTENYQTSSQNQTNMVRSGWATIVVRRSTKDRINLTRAPGQSYDGFLFQAMDVWDKVSTGRYRIERPWNKVVWNCNLVGSNNPAPWFISVVIPVFWRWKICGANLCLPFFSPKYQQTHRGFRIALTSHGPGRQDCICISVGSKVTTYSTLDFADFMIRGYINVSRKFLIPAGNV